MPVRRRKGRGKEETGRRGVEERMKDEG